MDDVVEFFEPLNERDLSQRQSGILTTDSSSFKCAPQRSPEPVSSENVSKRRERCLYGLFAGCMINEGIAMAVTFYMINMQALPPVGTLLLLCVVLNSLLFFWTPIKARWRLDSKPPITQSFSTTTVVTRIAWLKFMLLGGVLGLYTLFNLGIHKIETVILMSVIVAMVFHGPSHLRNNKLYQACPSVFAWSVLVMYVIVHLVFHVAFSNFKSEVILEHAHIKAVLTHNNLIGVILPATLITLPCVI